MPSIENKVYSFRQDKYEPPKYPEYTECLRILYEDNYQKGKIIPTHIVICYAHIKEKDFAITLGVFYPKNEKTSLTYSFFDIVDYFGKRYNGININNHGIPDKIQGISYIFDGYLTVFTLNLSNKEILFDLYTSLNFTSDIINTANDIINNWIKSNKNII